MATRRPGTRSWYIKRTVPGLGRVYRSLRTDRKALALARERMLLTLAERGRLDLVRAFLDGRLPLAELTEAVEAGRLPALTSRLQRTDVTLRQAIREALNAKEADVKASTLNRYETGLAHFEGFAGPGTNVADALEQGTVQAFKAARVQEKAAPETINNDLIAVSILASYAIAQSWITERPRVKKFQRKDRIRWLESNELNVYMAALRRPFRPLFELLVFTGMRLGEGEALRVCDLRFGAEETRALIEDAKSPSGVRALFVPPWTADSLRKHIEDLSMSGRDALFSMPRRTVQKEHKRACGIAGIVGYTIHDHRHTFAVSAARAGMPLNLIQQQLGHARIEMTMRYARFHPDYSDIGRHFIAMGERLGVAAVEAEVRS